MFCDFSSIEKAPSHPQMFMFCSPHVDRKCFFHRSHNFYKLNIFQPTSIYEDVENNDIFRRYF